ncbi:hypothetical protein A3E39_00985 [Candidatus Uhrbacteria bacterium RIFCSPHIGHO2_12_FULL_60_25]|uniref:Uncharacterized protein n=1 Tax=Candidatus Uhrbacteria bacterium RIFCSPHIGHO2_12_FULL_60_25 TaxID=1802399 RepID=A0A1F7UPP6_9BACT|nr:MAG: hypothetical protein A3D73_02815 [Candidatus Uhrbacteria bacterium RIFCSPHIGHO2_02_FULL_60_44]OGL79677.1 MAG: hypothetical protein A3E39_00985 [Candidatus Uhrbacteria bacterium RIFCSPHIGHO2_12_FULL_60_25]
MAENRIGGGFTEGELKFANVYVRHRILLRQIGYGSLIGMNVILWSVALWGLLDAYAISYPRESRISSEIAQNQFIATQLQSNRPQSIQASAVSVFQGTDDRLDFVVQVSNGNKDWWAEYTYRFNVSGEITPARSGFILPGEQTYLGEFGFKPATKGSRSGILTVDNIRWHRVDPAVAGNDYAAWATRRYAFEARNASYVSNLELAGKKYSRTSFTLVNPTAYGYWNVKLYVVLKRAQTPVAATSITLERVKAGESRAVNIDWFDRLPGAISDTEVVAVVNLLDSSSYLPSSP